MPIERTESIEIRTSNDIVRVRQLVREWAVEAGFSLVDQTKMVTAASELARNTLEHGGGGTARLEYLADGPRRGVRLVCEDQGPGIPDIQLALRDGYTSRSGLGLICIRQFPNRCTTSARKPGADQSRPLVA